MEPHVRASVAYIAGRLVSEKRSPAVFDRSRSKRILINGAVGPRLISVYDHDQRCQITGRGNGFHYEIYHHGDRHFIDLTLQETRFTGHDYGRSTPFTGTVQGNSVLLYELGTCKQFGYTLVRALDPPWSESEGELSTKADQTDPSSQPQ